MSKMQISKECTLHFLATQLVNYFTSNSSNISETAYNHLDNSNMRTLCKKKLEFLTNLNREETFIPQKIPVRLQTYIFIEITEHYNPENKIRKKILHSISPNTLSELTPNELALFFTPYYNYSWDNPEDKLFFEQHKKKFTDFCDLCELLSPDVIFKNFKADIRCFFSSLFYHVELPSSNYKEIKEKIEKVLSIND